MTTREIKYSGSQKRAIKRILKHSEKSYRQKLSYLTINNYGKTILCDSFSIYVLNKDLEELPHIPFKDYVKVNNLIKSINKAHRTYPKEHFKISMDKLNEIKSKKQLVRIGDCVFESIRLHDFLKIQQQNKITLFYINDSKTLKYGYFKNKFGWGLIMPVRQYDSVQYPSVVLEVDQ